MSRFLLDRLRRCLKSLTLNKPKMNYMIYKGGSKYYSRSKPPYYVYFVISALGIYVAFLSLDSLQLIIHIIVGSRDNRK